MIDNKVIPWQVQYPDGTQTWHNVSAEDLLSNLVGTGQIKAYRQSPDQTLMKRLAKLNAALYELGKTYYPYVSASLVLIDKALEANSFLPSTGTVDVTRPYSTEIGEGKYLHIHFHKMDSGNWEVVAYAN